VFLNGKPCTDVQWFQGATEQDGEAALSCITAADVNGLRSVFVCVGGEGVMSAPTNPLDLDALQAGQTRGAWSSAALPTATDRCVPPAPGGSAVCNACPADDAEGDAPSAGNTWLQWPRRAAPTTPTAT
jgi:hypothetical protein